MICISLGNIDFDEALKLASEVQMMEFRADLLDWSAAQYEALFGLIPYSLYTFRPGLKTEDERLEFYSFAVECGVNFIDVEIEASPEFIFDIRELIRNSKTDLILSYHNFEKTPDVTELTKIIENCYNAGADLVKIACMVNDQVEAANLLSLYQLPGRKVIIGMGQKGKIVRLAAEHLGAEFSFASPGKAMGTAAGQMTWREMDKINKILNS